MLAAFVRNAAPGLGLNLDPTFFLLNYSPAWPVILQMKDGYILWTNFLWAGCYNRTNELGEYTCTDGESF